MSEKNDQIKQALDAFKSVEEHPWKPGQFREIIISDDDYKIAIKALEAQLKPVDEDVLRAIDDFQGAQIPLVVLDQKNICTVGVEDILAESSINTIIKALEFMARNGEGMVVAPLEPTDEMLKIGFYTYQDSFGTYLTRMEYAYKAMIAAYKQNDETKQKGQVMTTDNKQYLGDGLYANFDGWQYALSAENGISVQNIVYLEPSVLQAFERYVAQIRKEIKEK